MSDEKWEDHPNAEIMGAGFTCSKCGAVYNWTFRYCPDCGHYHDRHLAPGFEKIRDHMVKRIERVIPAPFSRFAIIGVMGRISGSADNLEDYRRNLVDRLVDVEARMSTTARTLPGDLPGPAHRTGRQGLHVEVEPLPDVDGLRRYFCPGCGKLALGTIWTGVPETPCTFYGDLSPAEFEAAILELDITDDQRATMRAFYDPGAPL